MAYSQIEINEYAHRLGKSERTLWRWIKEGCNLRDPKSIREWQVRSEIRKTNIARAREKSRGKEPAVHTTPPGPAAGEVEGNGNDELPPAGPKRAQHALARLELEEAEAHRRLQLVLGRGNSVEIESAQQFWVRCVESLRKLDLSIELARRDAEQQVPLRQASDVALFISDWLRISFMLWLSSESRVLMGFQSVGEFKNHAVTTFRSILHLTVKSSLKTRSPIPDWAAEKVKESWNVEMDESVKID
jgi:hypothetical protein